MLQTGLAFAGGAVFGGSFQSCAPPCRPQVSCGEQNKVFKLSIVVHSATISDIEGGGMIENQRPLIGICMGDKAKETELGDWSKEKAQWHFRETVTFSVSHNDEICVYVSSSKRYNLLLASVSMTVQRIGELSLRVPEILAHLRMELLRQRVLLDDTDSVSVEDRETDGVVYSTPILPFDVVAGGRRVGVVRLSFETQNSPPTQRLLDAAACWLPVPACTEPSDERQKDESAFETAAPFASKLVESLPYSS